MSNWAYSNIVSLDVVELDVTNQATIDKTVNGILEDVGHIDVLVNNAGVAAFGILEGFTIEQTQALFDVNTFGPLRVAKAILPSMRDRGSGLLIHISSTVGRVNLPFTSPYSASKFALEALGEALHMQLAPFGIESLLVEPGLFGTEAFGKLFTPADEQVLADYGDLATAPMQTFAASAEMLRQPDAPDPQQVADAVKQLIDTPVGQRPLRTLVGPVTTEGVAELNVAYDVTMQRLAEASGLQPAQ
ncbi:SDR family NAD(P)-dependent oxidoreductase [Chloroflexi bacterium TSY]|nr:SDR family NAD(P)-dependent oxidoreductase [Chloroflexi bacterium TSY]